MRVLFIGDSVTDCGRDRSDPADLGSGYVAMVARSEDDSAATGRAGAVEFVNRGISGDRVRDLRRRWRQDCLDLRPDLVSILIGVNDTWRRYDSDDPTGVEDFERDYADLLDRTRRRLPATRIALLEPFLLPVRPAQRSWREDLDPKLAVVRRLAEEYAATLVPLDVVLTNAADESGPAALAADGVHPTAEGHALIARTWRETVSL